MAFILVFPFGALMLSFHTPRFSFPSTWAESRKATQTQALPSPLARSKRVSVDALRYTALRKSHKSANLLFTYVEVEAD